MPVFCKLADKLFDTTVDVVIGTPWVYLTVIPP